MLQQLWGILSTSAEAIWAWIQTMPKPLAEFLVQAAATLAGALAAFRLEARRQDHLQVSKQARDARRALYVLLSHRTFLLNLENQVLGPLTATDHREFLLKPIPLVPPSVGVDLAELAFLLETRHADLLNQIEVADRDYATVLALLRARNAMHSRFQDRLEERTLESLPSALAIEEVGRLVGPTIRNNLREMTDQLYELSARAIQSNRQVYARLDSSARLLFPKEHFLCLRKSDLARWFKLPNKRLLRSGPDASAHAP